MAACSSGLEEVGEYLRFVEVDLVGVGALDV
jgi:hypothetical protein